MNLIVRWEAEHLLDASLEHIHWRRPLLTSWRCCAAVAVGSVAAASAVAVPAAAAVYQRLGRLILRRRLRASATCGPLSGSSAAAPASARPAAGLGRRCVCSSSCFALRRSSLEALPAGSNEWRPNAPRKAWRLLGKATR